MKRQYKQYLTIDENIFDFPIAASDEETKFESIEDLEEVNIKDLKNIITEKIESGAFIEFLEKICRNRLYEIIPMLVLSEDDLKIYDLFYKQRKTQDEIGKEFNVTRQAISRRIQNINKKFECQAKNLTNCL